MPEENPWLESGQTLGFWSTPYEQLPRVPITCCSEVSCSDLFKPSWGSACWGGISTHVTEDDTKTQEKESPPHLSVSAAAFYASPLLTSLSFQEEAQ